MASSYWVGSDGNVWFKADNAAVRNVGKPINVGDNNFDSELFSAEATRIADPNPSVEQIPTGDGGGDGSAATIAANNAYLDDQANQLRDLLARTDTGLNQGIERIGSEYGREVGNANVDKAKQLGVYDENRVTQNTGKQDSYSTINKNANSGYRSLSQIIGRASGTGSSAYRDMLPNVIGTDISSKRHGVSETYGRNLQGIDKSQNEYLASFEEVLKDLENQKRANEQQLRTGIEEQRQGLNSQLQTNAATKAQNAGGGYAAVQAAQAPYQQAITNSRDAVTNFFNQFKPNYAPKAAAVSTPELNAYTVDRSTINAQGQQGVDPTNPYASLLRKRLIEQV